MATRRRERRGGEPGRRRRPEEGTTGPVGGFAFTPWSLGVGGGGLLLAVGGFTLVARGDITLAPLLLVVAYLIVFPIALVMRGRGSRGG
ncbi:MAG: hypothetical protein EA421_15485 [Gemmatimonadales bacterium]|nr:MAG: hypothetical protein EA421_15485 [Gemmatimonadales bacterium]